ncbi:VCBS repeat-containing protein [Arthrobacter sp. OAP107]|uniref:FG-GAP repeat domain-containing protein n=1 Tax=Arthrobacter sp. OAP107 TaxID=3156445 RepID=UPI00339AA22B
MSPRIKTGVGWAGLYVTVTDFDQDGGQDLLAKRSDGRMVLYRSTGTGGFVSGTRHTVGTGWNSINTITAVDGFQSTGSHGLMTRLVDGRLAHYPFSKGTWAHGPSSAQAGTTTSSGSRFSGPAWAGPPGQAARPGMATNPQKPGVAFRRSV